MVDVGVTNALFNIALGSNYYVLTGINIWQAVLSSIEKLWFNKLISINVLK